MVSSAVKRVTVAPLDGSYGTDQGRRVVVAFVPGKPACAGGKAVPDRLELRPMGTRRAETVTVLDVYRWAVHCRACRESLERARAAKARKAQALADRRQALAERRLLR